MKFKATTHEAKVTFSSSTKAGKGFSSFNQWVKRAKYGTLTLNEGENGEYTIKKLSIRDQNDFFTFDVEADSTESMYWQLENAKNFIKTLPGTLKFEASVLVEGDSVNWNNCD